jgi:hypothetical protein
MDVRTHVMSLHTFYRLAVWLPLALPGVAVLLVHGIGLRQTGSSFDEVMEILLASLLYGGVPYTPIALIATFWIDSRPERDIRRQALWAPLWLIVTYLLFAAALAGKSRQLLAPSLVFVLGAPMILVLGYLYVIVVFGLRDACFGPYRNATASPSSKWRWS